MLTLDDVLISARGSVLACPAECDGRPVIAPEELLPGLLVWNHLPEMWGGVVSELSQLRDARSRKLAEEAERLQAGILAKDDHAVARLNFMMQGEALTKRRPDLLKAVFTPERFAPSRSRSASDLGGSRNAGNAAGKCTRPDVGTCCCSARRGANVIANGGTNGTGRAPIGRAAPR